MDLDDFNWGLPSREQLDGYRIWDAYFTPSIGHPGSDGVSGILADMDRSQRAALELGRFEKLCLFPHVGIGTTSDPDLEDLLRRRPGVVRRLFEHWPGRLLGMIQLNANDPQSSRDALDRWLRDGPMLGVYFPGSGPGALSCSHPHFPPLVERIAEHGGLIMQHTWFVTGGNPQPGMSTPTDLAALAAKFPEQIFVCAHAGGEWEKGIAAVRDSANVLVETSGFDATAGFLEKAVRELGPERILFGSHLPSRSLGTELSKVTAAELDEQAKRLILGGNFRRILGMAAPGVGQ